jgi:hypothetical protein
MPVINHNFMASATPQGPEFFNRDYSNQAFEEIVPAIKKAGRNYHGLMAVLVATRTDTLENLCKDTFYPKVFSRSIKPEFATEKHKLLVKSGFMIFG